MYTRTHTHISVYVYANGKFEPHMVSTDFVTKRGRWRDGDAAPKTSGRSVISEHGVHSGVIEHD